MKNKRSEEREREREPKCECECKTLYMGTFRSRIFYTYITAQSFVSYKIEKRELMTLSLWCHPFRSIFIGAIIYIHKICFLSSSLYIFNTLFVHPNMPFVFITIMSPTVSMFNKNKRREKKMPSYLNQTELKKNSNIQSTTAHKLNVVYLKRVVCVAWYICCFFCVCFFIHLK